MDNHRITPLVETRQAWRMDDFCMNFGLSRSTVYNLMKEGRLKTVKVGGRRLIPVDAARELLAGAA